MNSLQIILISLITTLLSPEIWNSKTFKQLKEGFMSKEELTKKYGINWEEVEKYQ